jgi:hypothetical protein
MSEKKEEKIQKDEVKQTVERKPVREQDVEKKVADEQTIEEKSIEGVAPSEQHEDDAKRTGIKEAVVDSEGAAIKEKAGESIAKEKEALPSFFVNKDDRRKVEVDVLFGKDDGKIVSVSRFGIGIDFSEFKFLSHRVVWFEFSVPSYEDMSTYRQRCGVYRREAGQILVDRLQLRNFLLVWHLKNWSLTDSEGNVVEIKLDADGSLSEESLKKAYGVHASILDVVMTVLEKEILLT